MPDQGKLVLSGSKYKTLLIIPAGGTYQIKTGEEISWDDSSEGETIHAIGEEDPIAEVANNNKYSLKFSMQNGEMNSILLIEGLVSAIRIRGAIISVSAVVGGFNKTWTGVNILRAATSVKRKDKETLINMDAGAVGIA